MRFFYPILLAYFLSALMLAPVGIAAFVFGMNLSRPKAFTILSWGAALFITYGFLRAVL